MFNATPRQPTTLQTQPPSPKSFAPITLHIALLTTMKRLNQPIDVLSRDGYPRYIYHNGKTIEVQVIQNLWVIQGYWWISEQKRVYYRVQTPRGIMEIYKVKTGHTDTAEATNPSSKAASQREKQHQADKQFKPHSRNSSFMKLDGPGLDFGTLPWGKAGRSEGKGSQTTNQLNADLPAPNIALQAIPSKASGASRQAATSKTQERLNKHRSLDPESEEYNWVLWRILD